VMVTSVPYQLLSSQAVAEGDERDALVPGQVRRGETSERR